VEAVFIDVGSDGWDLGDLVPNRLGVFSLQCAATACAVGRLDLEDLSNLLGWDQGSGVPLMVGLTSTIPPGRRSGRPSLDLYSGRVGRWRLGGVRGVQVEPDLQVGDPLPQGDENGPDGCLGFRGDRVPE
jgi:hypothetical protein